MFSFQKRVDALVLDFYMSCSTDQLNQNNRHSSPILDIQGASSNQQLVQNDKQFLQILQKFSNEINGYIVIVISVSEQLYVLIVTFVSEWRLMDCFEWYFLA